MSVCVFRIPCVFCNEPSVDSSSCHELGVGYMFQYAFICDCKWDGFAAYYSIATVISVPSV